MASRAGILLASVLLLSCLAETSYGVLFSTLKQSLIVTASHVEANGTLLKAGEDKISVTWGLNQSLPAGTDSAYKTVTVKLCYAPVSQVDRAWRKTVDNLVKDKTCQHKIVARPYNASMQTFEWTVERDVPTAKYFVRAYAYDAVEVAVAYGQNTGPKKDSNLFEVQSITGRHVTLDIVSVCFSAFSVLALAGFFIAEKTRAKSSKRSVGN
ncbi:putative high-affinity nitrate transporter [Rosa chinensis]|uniref:High-affinity nitrate transporter n=1 Tax=Rosa chinensis TaxID=74649 RepID=A0A2P6P5I2_ROSCH|nr:high-affinity nitrate transporter 3.1 [Rosa chinensis]PRQ17197.1 putative high-affinity nitrate transporter [Rosa chinensis]